MNLPKLLTTGLFKKTFTNQQLESMTILDKTWILHGDKDIRKEAYLWATTYHETGATMLPITEWGGIKYLKSKKYWPYYGRGFCQLTWNYNYRAVGRKIGVDLIASPEKALEPAIAAEIAVRGMMKGWFTGKDLDDYINDAEKDYINARRIINILDKAVLIAGYAEKFEAALMV